MFEGSADAGTAALAALLDRLRGLGSGGPDVDDAVRIDRIRLLDPYCDAPMRHADHITPHEAGGPTRLHNGRGEPSRDVWRLHSLEG